MSKKVILGLVEEITLIGGNRKRQKVKARIDTGATSSSIDLKLAGRLQLGPITRSRIIKSVHGAKSRPIVTAHIKMDGLTIEEEFSLADRSHMRYPVLIGQNILKKGNFLVDPQKGEGKPQ